LDVWYDQILTPKGLGYVMRINYDDYKGNVDLYRGF